MIAAAQNNRWRSALGAVRLKLVARQLLRAAALGALCGGVCASLAVLLATLLAHVLFGGGVAAVISLLVGGAAGFAAGFMTAMRGYRVPDAAECALVLESADGERGAALVTLLGLPDRSPFAALLESPAQTELTRRRSRPLPPALPLWLMLGAPLAALIAALLVAVGANLPISLPAASLHEDHGGKLTTLDVATTRTRADAAAFAAASKLSKAAADLRNAANVLAGDDATGVEKQRALDAATRVAKDAASTVPDAGAAMPALPGAVAEDAAMRELAAKLLAVAGVWEKLAAELESGKRAPGGAGDGPVDEHRHWRVMAAFPAFEARVGLTGQDGLTTQTQARRELAMRAVELATK